MKTLQFGVLLSGPLFPGNFREQHRFLYPAEGGAITDRVCIYRALGKEAQEKARKELWPLAECLLQVEVWCGEDRQDGRVEDLWEVQDFFHKTDN